MFAQLSCGAGRNNEGREIRLRVLHVINTLDIGGAEVLISRMAPLFAARGVKLTVLVLSLRDRTLHDLLLARGIDVVVSQPDSIYSPCHVRFIRRLARVGRFDIIHAHLFPTIYWVALATVGLGTPTVMTEHSTWNRRRRAFLRPFERTIYSRYMGIACVTHQTAQALREWLPEVSTRASVIENGVDLSAFDQGALPSDAEGFTVITVARLTRAKAVEVLIRAVAEVPNVRVRIVGDGSLRGQLEKLTAALAVSERIQFLGARDDVAALLSSATIYVQTSAWEGFGIAAVEAMCAGLPVIFSDVPGLREVVADAGLKFMSNAHSELAERIRQLMNDSALRKELGTRARKRGATFSIARTVDKYVELYGQVTRPAGQARQAICLVQP